MFFWKRFLNLLMFGLLAEGDTGSTGSDDPKSTESKPDEPPIENKIPYDRFKKVNDELKAHKEKLANFEKAQAEAEKKRLEQDGKWQEAAELAEKKAREAEEKAAKITQESVKKMREYEIGLEASKQGINDIKDAVKLIDSDSIIINDDGSFSGITEAIEKLKTNKPYLFGSNGVGVHKDKPKVGGTQTTKESLLADPIAATKFRQDNPSEYDRIMGR